LGAVLDIYEAHKGKTLKSWPHSRKRVELVFRTLMARPFATLTSPDLQRLPIPIQPSSRLLSQFGQFDRR
jgi:hypothetical protein